ncbi:hypothetical protein C0J52_09140 [Blattella germanica]|nr:hypothetical protein C0J52_09140 [Blattella germanica]
MVNTDSTQECIVYISFWDSVKLHLFAFICGLWIIFKRFAQWAFTPDFFKIQKRDNPPPCLVDSTLGHHSYMKLKGVKLHYVESGDRDKPLLLLLHGFPDCWLSWRNQIPVLAQHYRVVSLDLKGFGDSDKPVWRRSYRVDTLLCELKEFVIALGVTNCTVIGHDLGAMLGWYLIHQYPDLIKKFVAISCPHPNVYWSDLPQGSAFNTRWVHFSQLPYLPEIDALKGDISIINQCFHHLHKKNSQEITFMEAYKYAFSRKEDWTGPINYYRNLPFSRVSEDSKKVEVPCLLITGNRDQFIHLESVVKSTDYVQKFTLKIADGAGHFPHQEMPDSVNKMLLSFLIVPDVRRTVEKTPSKGLVNLMFGAVSSTVKYGNNVLDAVQKKTNGVVSFFIYDLPQSLAIG